VPRLPRFSIRGVICTIAVIGCLCANASFLSENPTPLWAFENVRPNPYQGTSLGVAATLALPWLFLGVVRGLFRVRSDTTVSHREG
jgi:hypothetical protein